MLRIISGKHRGRKLIVPESKSVRPTTDRTRESVFNILTHSEFASGCLVGAKVLDVCCGSGAMGFEALSRGASSVTFLDNSPEALKIVEQNAKSLQEQSNISFLRADATSLPKANKRFGLIFIDPPYKDNLTDIILEQLTQKAWLEENAIIIVEQHENSKVPSCNLDYIESRKYGNSMVSFFKNINNRA